MYVIIVYDIEQERVAKVCKYLRQSLTWVQNSVFECTVDPAQWTAFRRRLEDIYNPDQDSLRFYYLGSNWQRRVEHLGAKKVPNLEGPLLI